MPRKRPHLGDVFTVSLTDDRVAVGQVLNIRLGKELFVVIYEGAHSRGVDTALRVAAEARPALLALTLDALFVHERWEIVGRADVRNDIPRPTFKVAVAPGKFVEEDLDARRIRPLSGPEVDQLPNRIVVAPIRVDKATKALHGIGPWAPTYDDLVAQTEGA